MSCKNPVNQTSSPLAELRISPTGEIVQCRGIQSCAGQRIAVNCIVEHVGLVHKLFDFYFVSQFCGGLTLELKW